METLYLSWSKVDEAIHAICETIKKEYDFDVIVGVSRGGLVPSVRMSHILEDKKLILMGAKCYKGIGEREERATITLSIKKEDVFGKKVLVVDDVADSGVTLVAVKEHIEKFSPKELKIAVLASKPMSAVKPDYSVFYTDKWIVFPWEREK